MAWVEALIVWHARGMPDDGCSTVSRSRGPAIVRSRYRRSVPVTTGS
jgi:hypothetical protein